MIELRMRRLVNFKTTSKAMYIYSYITYAFQINFYSQIIVDKLLKVVSI